MHSYAASEKYKKVVWPVKFLLEVIVKLCKQYWKKHRQLNDSEKYMTQIKKVLLQS